MTIMRKAFGATAEAVGERQVRVICSTAQIDRAGEEVVQSGIGLAYFRQNPVILWQHDPAKPVARATSIGLVNGAVQADIEFAPPGVSALADEICGLVKAGVVNCVSIGFQPIDMEPMDPSRPRGPQRYLSCELLEVSFVSIPANPGAAVVARAAPEESRVMVPVLRAPGAVDPADMMRVQKAIAAGRRVTLPKGWTIEMVEAGPSGATVDRTRLAKFISAAIRQKDLYDVGQLASVLEWLGWTLDCAAWEAAMEGDGSQVPAMLAEAMQAVANALLAMTAEEVAEAMADAREDVAGLLVDDAAASDADFVAAGATPALRKFRAGLVIAKAGRVLSGANEADLIKARDLIHGVIQQNQPSEGGEDEGATSTTTTDDAIKAAEAEARKRFAESMALSVV